MSPAGSSSSRLRPSTPRTPQTPRGERRFRQQLELYLSPQPGPSQPGPSSAGTFLAASRPASPPPTGPSSRRRTREQKRPNNDLTDPDAEQDLIESDEGDEYVPTQSEYEDSETELFHDEAEGTEDKVAEGDEDQDAEGDEELARGAIPEIDDESDDDVDLRNERRNNRMEFRALMEERNRIATDAWSQPDVWNCQCDECQHILSHSIICSRIEQTTRWNQIKNDVPPNVIQMVLRGVLPTKARKEWRDMASMPILYASGLMQFL